MEEDIKILEDYIELIKKGYCEECNELCNIYGTPTYPARKISEATEHLIKAYKELEEENEKYIVQLTDEQYRKLVDNIINDVNKEWKSLVKEKIEELDEELEIMKVDAMYGRYKEYDSKLSFEKQFRYKYGMHDVLQELLEKRK